MRLTFAERERFAQEGLSREDLSLLLVRQQSEIILRCCYFDGKGLHFRCTARERCRRAPSSQPFLFLPSLFLPSLFLFFSAPLSLNKFGFASPPTPPFCPNCAHIEVRR